MVISGEAVDLTVVVAAGTAVVKGGRDAGMRPLNGLDEADGMKDDEPTEDVRGTIVGEISGLLGGDEDGAR